MTIRFLVYEDGQSLSRIVRYGRCDEGDLNAQAGEGERVIVDPIPGGVSGRLQAVEVVEGDPHVVDREPLPVSVDKAEIEANSEDTATISGVPEGALVYAPDGTAVFSDGSPIEVTADEPGTYIVTIAAPLHLSTDVEIAAV